MANVTGSNTVNEVDDIRELAAAFAVSLKKRTDDPERDPSLGKALQTRDVVIVLLSFTRAHLIDDEPKVAQELSRVVRFLAGLQDE